MNIEEVWENLQVRVDISEVGTIEDLRQVFEDQLLTRDPAGIDRSTGKQNIVDRSDAFFKINEIQESAQQKLLSDIITAPIGSPELVQISNNLDDFDTPRRNVLSAAIESKRGLPTFVPEIDDRLEGIVEAPTNASLRARGFEDDEFDDARARAIVILEEEGRNIAADQIRRRLGVEL